MDGLNYAKLMDLFNAQTGIVNNLWNIFIAVSLGVLGFVLKEKELRDNRKIKLLFSLGFTFFAVGNCRAISRSQAILVAISETLVQAPVTQDQYRSVFQAYRVPSVSSIQIGHILFASFVVLAMWLPDIYSGFRKKRESRRH